MTELTDFISSEWKELLKAEFTKPYFQTIIEFLKNEEKENKVVFPPVNEVFNAFNLTPFEQIKAVIIGQDPYHGKGQAHGLCFSVKKGVTPPPSLINIFKEIKSDCGIEIPAHGDLSGWAKQGVLLLNAILTVRENQPGSHQHIGWQTFIDRVISLISEKKEGIVFMLWGKFAQNKIALIDENKHYILQAAHPSPYSASAGFFGCRHFSKCNEILKSYRRTTINWALN